jgi:Ca2+-binding RTX toxin-like protein
MAFKTWTTSVSDNWSNAARWTPSAPLAGDQVFIGNTTQIGAFIVTDDVTLALSTLTLAGNHKSNQTTTLSITPAATLTASGAISFDGDSIITGNGVLVANGGINGLGKIVAANNGTLDITGTGAIASGVVLDFDVSTTLGSTLKLDVSGGVTAATNIRMNNAQQVLQIGPSTTLTITDAAGPEVVSKGTLRMAGGTVADARGIVVGGQGAPGFITGFGTITADLTGGGQKAQIDTVTASGGTLVLSGGFVAGTATFVAAIDTTPGSTLQFNGAAAVGQPLVINNAAQTLAIGATGALTLTGLQVVTNGTVRMDGGSLSDSSGLIIDTAATLTGKGLITASTAVSGDGVVKASGGVLELCSNLTASTTTFGVDTVAGSVLRVDGAVGALTTLRFLGGSGVIELADIAGGILQGFSGRIAGLGVSGNAGVPTNAIDLQATATKAVLNGSTITVFNGASVIGTLVLDAAPVAGAHAVVRSDLALGGSDVFLTNQPPPPPSKPVLAPGSDSGTQGDNRTNIATPVITGGGVAGATVTLLDGITTAGSATVDNLGHWQITSAALTEGTNALTATQTDAFGNTSIASPALSLVLDTTAPATPPAPDLQATSDTGASSTDNVTSDTTPTFSGTTEANATVTLRDGIATLGSVVADGAGHWAFTTAILVSGTHAVSARVTDTAGNLSALSPALSVVIDTTPPVAPAITSVGSAAISGSAEPAATVAVFDGVTLLGSTAANGVGAWTLPTVLGAGTRQLTARATDLAGNASTVSTAVTAVIGTSGGDALSGGPGPIVMIGKAGDDVYTVADAGDTVVEAPGDGNDTVQASVSYVLTAGAAVETLRGSGAAGLTLTGNELANTLIGGTGNDTLNGAGGDDRFVAAVGDGSDHYDGGSGVDTYDLSATTAAATVSLATGKASSVDIGSDTLASVENVVGGTGADTITGDGLANTLAGGAGNDILNGGAGADTMTGGIGNDTYFVDNSADVVTEAAGQGSDTIFTSVSYTLGAGQEIETLQANSAAGLTLTGNELANVLNGGAGGDTLNGSGGNDTLNGGAGADTMAGGIGNDTYFVDNAADVVNEAVGQGNDQVLAGVSYTLGAGQEIETLQATSAAGVTLTGNEFANTLISGAGSDTMVGGFGNDTYLVNNATDVVTEAAGQGTDRVLASVSYTLGAGQEIETLQVNSAAGLTLTGNELANVLNGGGGADTLNGGDGNDILNGGAGADTMNGGTGNDTYFVDNAADVVNEAAGQGTDRILTSLSYTLGAGQEIETLQANSAAGLTLTGNELANVLNGGAGADTLNGSGGNDTLNGGAGADTMSGGIGNDTYVVDNAADVVTEAAGQGSDTVFANVGYTLAAGSEIEFLRANTGAGLTLVGNELANTVVGGAGADTLDGGLGNDTLTGGGGNDVFRFVPGFGNDIITDFAPGTVVGAQDLMDVSGLGITAANFAGSVGIAASGANTLITIGAATIKLNGVLAASISSSDFVLG